MRPFVIVLEMQRMFTGPTGMAIARPASTPRSSNSSSFIDAYIMRDVRLPRSFPPAAPRVRGRPWPGKRGEDHGCNSGCARIDALIPSVRPHKRGGRFPYNVGVIAKWLFLAFCSVAAFAASGPGKVFPYSYTQ